MNYEIILDNPFNRTSVERPMEGTIKREAEIDLSPTNKERYLSMLGFDNSIYQFVELNNTVSGFNGNYFCKYVYFDVDCEDLNESLSNARELVKGLYNALEVNPKYLFISFSGAKGFHVGLHQNLFGKIAPSKDLPALIKVLAVMILANCYSTTLSAIDQEVMSKKDKIFKGCDLKIYNANRIFRTLNSINSKSGFYKIGITSNEILNLSIDQIKELAKAPRLDYRLETLTKDLPVCAELLALWNEAKQFDSVEYAKKAKGDRPEGFSGDFFAPPTKGSRNETLFAQACMLFDHSDFAAETVRQLVSTINQAGVDPLPESEVSAIVKSAGKRTSKNEGFTAKNAKSDKSIQVFNDWFDEWVEHYSTEQAKLTCLFKEFDEDQEMNYRSKVLGLIGPGGTRKSYVAQNIFVKNILDHNARIVYSSMEMGKIEIVNRLLDIYFDPFSEYPNMSVSKVMQQNLKLNKSATVAMVKEASSKLSDNLILSDTGFMDATDYRELIKKTDEMYGKVDILVIDGLSMMKGKGNENETMMKNSAEIKQLAKDLNIMVVVMCHTTKEANEYIRDNRRMVRGSEKILDNFDFFIMCSSLIDEFASTAENIQAVKGMGHVKYYNKRGSGATFNLLYDFASLTKTVHPSYRDPKEFPEYESFIKNYAIKTKNKAAEASPW